MCCFADTAWNYHLKNKNNCANTNHKPGIRMAPCTVWSPAPPLSRQHGMHGLQQHMKPDWLPCSAISVHRSFSV